MSKSFSLTKDEWLAGVLQRPVYRFDIGDNHAEEHRETMAGRPLDIDSAMAMPRVFIYSKVSPQQVGQVSFLEEKGFRLVDTNILLSKPRSACFKDDGHILCRFASGSDEEETVTLAGHAFMFSRFHLDAAFDTDTANHIKSEWARNYFNGKRGDYMVVAVVKGRVVGFLQLLDRQKEDLIIDLSAVNELHRRQGIARKMIEFAEANCGDYRRIDVGTQIANTASLTAYESIGFRFQNASYVFHYHGSLQAERF